MLSSELHDEALMNEANSSGLNEYVIKVRSHLDHKQSYWFEGMTMTTGYDEDGRPITTLAGQLADQAALQGVLAKIGDLNLTLISVNPVVFNVRNESQETGDRGGFERHPA
jgi:hypothetical protein